MADATEDQREKARQALADSALMPSAMERAAHISQVVADEAERAANLAEENIRNWIRLHLGKDAADAFEGRDLDDTE